MKIRAKFIKDAVAHKVGGAVTIPAGEIADLSVASFNRWHRRGCVVALERVDDAPRKGGKVSRVSEVSAGKDDGKADGASAVGGADAKGTEKAGNPG